MAGLVPFNGRLIDLEAHRASKARTSRWGNLIPWPVTHAQYHRACELLAQLQQTQEGTDLYLALVDDLKSIPGYPRGFDQDRDTLYFTFTDSTPHVQRR